MVDDPHSQPAESVLSANDTTAEGLPPAEAQQRLVEHGANEVVQVDERTSLSILVAQFDSVLIWVLLAAAILSVWAGHTIDIVLIIVIVVANGIFGFVQDYRAEQSLESLRELTAPTATVRRDGTITEIDATELVSGDERDEHHQNEGEDNDGARNLKNRHTSGDPSRTLRCSLPLFSYRGGRRR